MFAKKTSNCRTAKNSPKIVESIRRVNRRYSRDCANRVRFLAYGGFRNSDAAKITWADCDFDRREIVVRGDAKTGTKNWTIRRVPTLTSLATLPGSLPPLSEFPTGPRLLDESREVLHLTHLVVRF